MRRLKRFGFNAIKEGFDKLPSAVCFFDDIGGVVLCNRQMYRLSQHLLGRNLLYLGEFEQALLSPPQSIKPLSDTDKIYLFPDNRVWQFEKTKISDEYGKNYIQLYASDVTELHKALMQLEKDNRTLQLESEKLIQLTENAKAIAKEKEQLAAKAAMHDNLAACITVTKQFLMGDFDEISAETVLHEWEKSIAFRDSVLVPEKEKLLEIAKSCGVAVKISGAKPNSGTENLLYSAMQVCLNNAIRYAGATELYVEMNKGTAGYTALIKNNGTPPNGTIKEGGGLTNLRRRIEKAGGKMKIQSLPEFVLSIYIPNADLTEE